MVVDEPRSKREIKGDLVGVGIEQGDVGLDVRLDLQIREEELDELLGLADAARHCGRRRRRGGRLIRSGDGLDGAAVGLVASARLAGVAVPERDELLEDVLVGDEPLGVALDHLLDDGDACLHLCRRGALCEEREEELVARTRHLLPELWPIIRGEGELDHAQELGVAQLVALEEVRYRLFGEAVEEERERLGEGRCARTAQLRLDLGHRRGQPGKELERRLGQEAEDVDDGDERLDLLVVAQGACGGPEEHCRLGEAGEMVEQLGANLDLEVVGEQLQQPRQSLQSGRREPVAVGERHEDGPEAALQQILGQLALLAQHRLERLVRDLHHLLAPRVETLEVDRDDLHAHLRVLGREEVAACHGRRQQPDGNDPKLGDGDHVLVLRGPADERLIVGVRQRKRLGEDAVELLVELGQRRCEVECKGDGVDVSDLHAEGQRAQRLGEDGLEQALLLRGEQLGDGALAQLCEQLERGLSGGADGGVGAGQLWHQDADEVGEVAGSLGNRRLSLALGGRVGGVRLTDDLEERVADLVDVAGWVVGHVLEHEEQRTYDLELMVAHPDLAEVGAAHEHVDAEPAAGLALPQLLVALGAELAGERVHDDVAEVGTRGGRLFAGGEELTDDLQLQLDERRRVVCPPR
ncbi:hypothetical protein L1887_50215 [Cichorium endivia]|nr:hypothetical protein L1887_50215 [Cichorium endivia]